MVFYQYPFDSDNKKLTKNLVMDKFCEFGKILYLEIPKHDTDNLPIGYAFFQFENAKAK
jgi:hypothetical protein